MARTDEFSTMCATKKGRDVCAARVIDMALRLGATFEREDRSEHREIYLCLAYGPYRVSMDFEGGSKSRCVPRPLAHENQLYCDVSKNVCRIDRRHDQ